MIGRHYKLLKLGIYSMDTCSNGQLRGYAGGTPESLEYAPNCVNIPKITVRKVSSVVQRLAKISYIEDES